MKVVVIGGLHHNLLGVIRSLGEAGVQKNDINVLIVGAKIPEKNIIAKSKYVRLFDVCETYNDILPWLLKLSKTDGIKRTVICCSDGCSEAVISNADKLRDEYNIPETKISITDLMEKEYQDDIARRCGLFVPEGALISDFKKISWNTFPYIIKPSKSIAGAGKADIRISNDKEELLANLQGVKADAVQVQRYIQKKMEFQLIGCSLDGGGQIIIPGFTKIIRQPKNTNTGYLLYSPISSLKFDGVAVERFIKEIGYSGLFSMEFIRGEDDKDYFLEINMRNDGNAYCVKTAGVNLPYIWCCYQETGVIPNVKTEFETPIYFMPDYYDLSYGIHEKGILGWIHEFFGAKSHTLFNLKDMGPFIYETSRIMRRIIKRKLNHTK